MEEEQRKKKLEAGKERLAAFRKKKIRKKPKRASDDDQSSLLGADGNLADASSNSDVQSLTGDSDQWSVSASDDWSAEESDLHSSVYYQTKLTDAVRRVAELEEIVAGKQLALDKVITENAELLQSAETSKTQADSENNLVDTCEAPQGGHLPVMNPTDVQTALAQRDIIIQQLTARLRAAADKSSHDYTQEAQHLAQQVTLLQQQLQQAGETLRGQLNQHNSSAQALQEAKAEILALQVILKEKEDVLVNLNQQIALKDEENQTLHSQLVSHQASDDVRFEIHGFEGQLKDKENLIIQLNQQLKQKDEEEKVLQNLLEEQQLKEKELQERLIHIEAKAKELESFVTQHEARTKELESYVEECTGREKEFVTCIEQHTKREQDLEVWVKQYASREQVYQESIKSFEAKLALFTKEKEVSLESLQLNGQDEKLSALMLELQNLESKNNEFETELNLLKQDKHELESRCCSVETQKCELEATVKELKDELESRNSETQTRYSELETESENEKQRLMSNLESKSVELEEFCKQIDEMQDEFASKQSENDELRNKINDQQGDIVTLKSQLEMLLQDEEQSGQEIDVLKELLETKDKVHAAELQEKDVLIVQLQTDLKSLQDEKSSYIATIENLSSQIVTFQTDLARSADECESFKVLAEKYKSELDEENDRHVSGEAASDDDDDDDDDVDHADAFAVESELEVRRIETQSQKSISVQQYSADSVNVNAETKELLTKEASVSFLEDDIEKETMDNQNQTLPPSKVLGNSDEAQDLKIELEKLNGVCSSQSAKIFDLEGRISVLEKEVSSAHTQVEEIQGKLVEADHRNLILLSQQKEMTSEIQSLSSEVLNTTKLRESCLKCERLALCLSEETELRTQSLAKLQSAEKEVAMCRNSLDEKTEELEEEKDAKNKIQQQCVKFESELKMLMTERDALQKNECEKHSKEIQRLQTELKEVVEKHSQEIQLLQTELIEAKEHGEEVPRLRTKLAEAAATHSECIQGLTSQLTEASAKHSDEIQQLQRELTDSKDYSVEVTKLKSELTATEKKNGDEIQTVQAQLKEMEDKLHDVNQSSETRLQSLHQECEQYKSETSLLQQDISEKMELLSTSEEQRSGLEARCSALSSEVECLKHEHSTLQDELDKSLLNLQEDQVKLDSMSIEISSLKEEANEAAAETSLLQCQYESVSSELHQYKENCNQQGQELTSLKQTLATKEEFGTERVELLEEIQKHQQQLTEVETSLSVQSSEVNDLKELLHSKQRELSETAAKLGEVMEGGKQTETELQRKCSDQVAEIGRLQFENEALLKNIENIKKEADSARSDLQTEIGMLQQELKKVKYEHEQVINEEVSLKSEMKVQLDASCSEIEQLQTKLQKTETELENVLHKFEDQKQDFDEQVNEMSAKLEEVKNGNKALKSEVEELTVKYHNEQDSRRASQDQHEHLLADIKKLENELETSREKMLTLDHLKQDLEERLFIEQTARDDVQSQYESLSSEFYKVNANDKKQSKDLFSHKQRLKDLLNVCFLEEDVPEVKSTDEYLSILEEYVSNSKIKFEELTATHHDLMDKFSGSEKTRSELSDRIEIMNVCETSLVTEIEDLKSQLKRTESELASLLPELKAMEAKANSVEEEKEILKANFDACIEDMQQKLSEQENQTRNLQSQLVESAKDSDQIATDVKMMYETHISDLEDKIVKMEGEVLQAKNSLSEQSDIKKSIDESYESKLVELELCVSSKEVEIVSLQDQLSKCRENFQLEKDELRNDFEIQITELEDSCRSMESGMMRLQTQMSEASKFHKQEKEETEKEFDIQISEVEDKCRSLEMDNGKLKRQMDEMAKDFCCEKEEMERIYERQILELEDKCSHSELKANQSRQHVNDIFMDFGDEREAYEERIHALEINCVEIEKSRCDAEQRLRLVTEAAQEDKRVLQQNMSAELNELKKRHTVLETEHLALKEFLKQEEQSHKDHLETVTIQYENQVHELLNKCQVLSQQVRDHSTERELLQTNDVDNQESLKVALESLKVSLAGLELEKKELQLLLEKERESAKESVQKWSTEKEELRLSLKGVQEDASEVHQRLSEIQEKHENEVKSYQQQIASLTDSAGVKVDEGLPKQVSKLNKELASSKEELSREKLKTRAAKKSVEKYKKELQKQKVNSQQEIDALKTRLEAWEVELIQRRRFVETAAPGTDLKLIHRHNLQKVEEAPEDDILEGMDPSAEEFMKAESKRLSSKEQCLGEFEPIQDSDFTDSFEPEPPTPEIMKIEPKFPLLVVTSSAHTQKGFQPEIQGEGFIQENDNSPTLYSGKTENTNIQVESHSSQSLDSVIHGDGFQPEIDIAKADTFQPELVTEFKQDDQLPSGLKPENEPDLCKLSSNRDQSKLADIPQKPSSEKEQSESSTEEAQLVKRQLQQEKDELEEQYVRKMKEQEVELQVKHKIGMETYQKEVDKKMRHEVATVKQEKHQAFIKALKKARKQLEEKHKQEVERMKQEMASSSESDLVQQLQRDNQDLAEARDALLQEISRNQKEVMRGQSTSSPKAEQHKNISDWIPSDKFLEELESVSRRSESEPPFEWELTMSQEEGVFDRELDNEGFCTRPECLELKQKYFRLSELYTQAQEQTTDVFLEEDELQRSQVSGFGARSRLHSDPGSEITNLTDPVNTSQDVSEGDYFEDSFKERIQKLEMENIALEKKLCDQLELLGMEKLQLEQKCESLQVNLTDTALSRQEVEERLMKQNEMLQSSLAQLKTGLKQTTDPQPEEPVRSYAEFGMVSLQTQTDLSGDVVSTSSHEHSVSSAVSDTLHQESSSAVGNESVDEAVNMLRNERTKARTELTFLGSEHEMSLSKISNIPSSSPQFLPSVDHMERIVFSDSPMSRRQIRGKRPQPVEISFNTTSVVSMQSTQGGVSVNKEQIEVTGTVSSAGNIVPEDYAKVALEIHHTEMVEEINRLKQELHDSKGTYATENAMLKEEVEREKIARQLWLEKKDPDENVLKELPLQTDVIELRKEVALFKENNKMLMRENQQLIDQVRDKECMMLQFRDKFGAEAITFEGSNDSDSQLLMLQKQRDELLEEIQDFHSEHERLLSVLDARTAMEEALRREKELLLEKLVQFEDSQAMVTHKHTELEFLRGEQRKMEQALLTKDESERQLLKQKRFLEEDMYEIEAKLREREAFLEEEKFRLMKEVKEKNLTILKLEKLTGSSEGASGGPGGPRVRRGSTGQLAKTAPLPGMDASYDEAIEILREKLKLQYDAKEADLNALHAGELAAIWQQQNKKLESLRIQHESQMETLQSELVAEREFNSQNALQLEEQHQQMVARLRDELEAEKATMLDTVLMQIGELTKKKIQLAKNENKEEIALQVQAMRVTMEQVHTGQLTVLRGELEEARRSQHGHDESHTKEHQQSSTDSLSVKTNHGAMPDFGPLDESLTRKYEQLVNKINEQLECQVLPELEEGGESDETPRATEAIRSLLEGQREEISQLRSQMLSEYETLLRSRTENVSEQSKQVTQLQQEIESLQAQYEGQIKTFEEQLQSMSESDEAKVKTQEVQARELEELRSYYEKHVQNIEKTFSEEIAGLRSNYEAQISQLTSSKESESPSDSKESIEFTREREYVKRTTMLTVISDSDESSTAESSRIGMPSSGIGTLEKQIQEQNTKISELEKLLDDEKIKFVSSEKEIKSLKNQVNELEKRVKDLSDAIEEKDHMIGNLRAENDLLTKEIEKSKVEFVEKANEFEKEREKFVKDLEEKEKVISDLEGEREKYLVELQEKEIKSDDSSSVDYSQDKYDLLTRIEDMEHRHKEELESVRNELEHDSKVEIETMQSEFKVQLEIELKRQAADLQKIHEENVKNLAFGQDVHDHSEIQEEATPDTMELQTSSDEVSISNGAVNISDGVDGVPVDVLREEYEQKVATLKMELEQLRMEREELSRKHQLDMDNLQTQLTEIQEKYENLMTDKDVDEDSNVEELLKEKYDQQLELSKQLMQQEFTETLESERSRFVERHRKMMDNFMADRTQEAEELKVKHEKELEDLRGQLTAEHQQQVEELGQKHEKYLESLRQDLTSQHNEELFEVKLQHHKELETVASRSSEQGVEDESKQKSEDAQDEVDAVPDYMQGQEVELHKLTVEWEQKIRELKISHADELSAAALDTETVKSELEAAHQKELQDLEGRLKRAHEDEVERIQKELQDLEGRLKRTHEDEVERIQEELEEKEKLLSKTHRKEIEKLEAQHQEEIEKLKDEQKESSIPGRHQEAMREISEVFLPPQTTPLLSAADLDSTIESEISGADGDFLMKSTPRDPPVMSRGSTPDEMLETRTFAEVVRGIPPVPSAADLMEKEEKIQQLENEVKELKTKLDDVHSDEQLLTGRRTREAEEDSNLVHMLRSDLDRIGAERDAVQSANDRLLQFLSDSVKNYMSVEDAINRRLSRLVNQSGQRSRPPSGTPRDDRHGSEVDHRGRSSDYGARAASPRSDRGDPNTSQDSTALEETSILSSNTDEGLDVSQRLTESIFAGPELDPEGEEILTDARGRVQTSVNHLLEMIEKTTQQLLDAKQTQQELVDTLASRNSESETIQARCTEVEDRLREEVSAKEYLALELHKAEGLISGYSTERDSLESRLESLDEQRQALVLDLETTRSKLHEFQESQDELQSQQDLVTRQQQILTSNAGQETQDHVREMFREGQQFDAVETQQMTLANPTETREEVSTLTQERRELEKQTRHQLERSQSRITELESLLEEEQQLHEQVVRIKKEEIEDLRLQLDNLERQLKASKQFLTEQSAEREQEHEEYQREVDRLQQLLQDREKKQSAEGRLQREVQDLSEQLEDRIASEGELDMQRQRLQQVLQDKEVTAAELKQWVQQLESELEEKITTEQKLRQTINRLEKQLSSRSVPEETSDSSLNSTAEQLQFKPAVMSPDRRSPIRRQITLEEELERTRKTGEELALEKETLQQQVQEQLLQISALKNQLDDMRQYGRDVSTVTHTSQLRERLAVERESLEMKEEEVTSLQEQKDKLKHMLAERESEVSGLRKELEEVENQTPSMSNTEQKVREENANLKAEVEKLLGHQEDTVDVGMPKLAQDLLDEKNREIDELTDRVQQLEMALEATSVIDDSIRENDEIDLLREELKQKMEQIAELQDKLATAQGGQFFGEMSLTDADRSLLETSFSEKTNFQQELEETIAQKTEEMSDLRKELETSQLALTEVEAEKIGIKTDLENHVHELEEQLETVEASNKDLKEQINQLQNKHDATLKNLQDAEKRLYDSTGDSEQNQNLQEELQTLQEDLNITRNKLAESECLKSELESAKMALKESEKRLEDLTTKSLKKSSEQEEESSADGKNLQTELETVQRALAENEDHLAEKTEIISELEARIVEMKNAETNSESQKMELENQLREIREAVRETEAKLLSQELHMSELKLEIEESKQNLKINTEKDESAERVTELETELDEARTAVTVVEEKLSKEISDLLAQLEQTEKSLKDAESKLGEQSEVIDPEANTEVDELRKQLEDVQAALQESEARLTLQDSQLDSAQETVEEERLNMTAQLEELATELESVKAAQHFIEQEKEQFQKQLQDKESQINSLQESLKTLEEEHASLAAQNIIEKEKKELQKQLQDKESELSSLQESSKTLEEEHASLTAQNAEAESEVEKLQDAVRGLEEEQESLLSRLSEKEQELQQMQEERDLKQLTLEQFSVQVDTFQEEIKSLTTFQNELQKDFDTVQSMLEEKEREIEHLTKELSESRLPPEGATSEIQDKYETEILGLKKTLQEKENIIDEKEEELYVLNEKLELQESINSELSTVRQQVADTEVSLDEERKSNKRLQDELQELRTKQSTNQQENGIDALNSNLVSEDQLQEQLSQKEEKLECVQAEVEELKEQLSGQQKELNEVQEKLRDKQRQLEELEATETDALVDTLKLRVTELEAQLQVSREVEAKNAEDPKKQLEEDGAVVQDDVVVSFVEETESPLPGDPNETRNIMEGLNERIAQLEQELCEKGDLVSRLRMESSGETPGQVDLGQQLREKTQLYDQLLTDKINLEKTLIDLENKLEEKQESLEKLEQDVSSLAEKDEVISKLEEQLKERKGEKPSDEPMDVQEDKERLVQEFEIKCHELNIKLATAADEKLNLETELGEKDSKIAELESKYEDLKEQTREEASRLEEEIQKIQEVQADVQLLQQTQKREQELERELEKAQDNLEILEKTRQKLAATEASLEQTLVKLTERDEQIKALFDKGQVPLDTSTNDEVNRSLEDSQQEVYELSLELHEKEEDIERLQVSLTATEEELEKKSSQLRQAEQHLETKSRELRENEERLRQTSLDLAARREEHLGSSLPLDLGDLGDQNQQQITRSESEPVLNNWRRESSFFRSRLHDVESLAREQKQELTQKNLELALVRQQLEQWLNRDLRGEGDAGTLVATLRQDLQEKDKLIQLLQIEIDEINETLALREEEIQDLRASESLRYSGPREATPPASEQQIRHLKNELRKAKTVLAAIQHSGDYLDRTPEGSAVEDELSPVRLNDDARSLRRELGQMREELQLYRTTASMSARDFVKKVMELREELSEEHKNHIRDIQERLKMDAESQLTTLQLRHEDEMKQLRQIHERKMDAALAEQRQELEKLHKSEVNRMIAEHKHQLDLVRDEGFVRDDASVTDLQQNLLADIHDTERMDNRLLDHLTRAEGVGGEDSDTATVSETPSLDTALTPGLSTKLQTLLSRLHKKGVHVLTLSELQFLQRHMTPDEVGSEINVDALRQAWEREQEALLATINSLKDLLARVHKTNNADELPDEEDWRGDLLTALCDVFTKERESLLAELRSYVVSRPDQDSVARRLEQRIADQASLHRSALDRVQHAERQSLLAEISLLRKKLSVVRQRNDEQQQTYNDKLSTLEDQSAKKERHQQRQIQVLEYKLQQEKVIQDDIKTSLDLERQRVREISSELSREKNIGLELQGELSTSQIQLSKARDALERERSRYTSVNDALEEERTKISRLTELLESERRKCALLDSQVADLRSHNKDYLEKESRFVEQLRKELEREREKRIECTRHIEQERQNKNSLQEQLEEERRRSRSVQSECDSMVAQLKLSLEAERGKIDDMDRNIEEERKSTAHVRSTLEQERAQHHELVNQDRAVIEDVEARLRSEQNKVEDLHRALAREKQGLSSLSDLLESERDTVRQTLEHERAVARQLKRDSEDLQVEKAELKRQIEFERENVKTYQDQTEKLHEEVKVLKQRENEYIARVDNQQGTTRKTIRELERERDQLKINMHELELESERLREKLQDTHVELDEVRGKEMKTRHELDRVRLEASSTQRSPPTVDRVSAVRSGTDVRDAYPQLRGDMLDNVLQKLEFVAVRMQDKPVTVANGEDVVDAQVDLQTDYTANIRNLITEIKEIKESVNEVTGSASAGQIANEKIVQHNADLTAFINRVSREKEELRTSVQALEDQLAVYRSRARSEQVRTVEVTDREQEDRYLQDRMAWAGERLSLQMALDAAEREVTHLQSELRHVRIQLESEEYQDVDREKMQRLYGKFLRAESFRKALVYQKRYLLLLLGGYQDCEQETLMLIAQMGGYPSDIDLRRRSRHSRFFSLFRSAARVIIAIARMRYMVRKWRRAVRVGSPVVGGRVNLNLGYMPSSTTYSPPRPTTSPRHFPSMSRIPDVPRASVSDSILVSNGDLMHTYPPPSSGVTRRQFTTPPTKDTSATSQRSCDRSLSSSARRRILQDGNNVMSTNARNYSGSAREDESTDDFLHRLESLQTRLGSYNTGAATRSVSWR